MRGFPPLLLPTIIAVCALAPVAAAELATQDDAARVAENWLAAVIHDSGDWSRALDPNVARVGEIRTGEKLLGWCCSIDPRGYVVVPVLKERPPVKAYSEECGLDVDAPGGFASLLREVLTDRLALYEREYGALEETQPRDARPLFDRANREAWGALLEDPDIFRARLGSGVLGGTREAGPLLTSSWHQSSPYNNDCPLGDGGRSLVGCVATAGAQILRYHEWPPCGSGGQTYFWNGDQSCGGTTDGGALTAYFGDDYAWSDMPDSCDGGCSAAQQAAVAELCYEVGAAFEMDYGLCNSGAHTYGGRTVYPNYFEYKPTTFCAHRAESATPDDWFDLIVSEIDAGRPMHYRIEDHSIVCDGWRTQLLLSQYHINYGWGDGHTAWYTLDMIYGSTPLEEYFIGGIEPDRRGTGFVYGVENRFKDWFREEISEALSDSALIIVTHPDGIGSVTLYASDNAGTTWDAYQCIESPPGSGQWVVPPPATQIRESTEIRHWFEATTMLGEMRRCPQNAPVAYFEFSILPIEGDINDKGILLVDKHGLLTPGDDATLRESEHYYRDMLGILGYEWDTYDVPNTWSDAQGADGPDSAGYKYYDTVVWFTNNRHEGTVTQDDQRNLMMWLNQSSEALPRNLLLTGNNIGYELEVVGPGTTAFYRLWAASDYLWPMIGEDTCNSTLIYDNAGSWELMTHGDGACVLHQGSPRPNEYDAIGPTPGGPGAMTTVNYDDGYNVWSAGIQHVDPTLGYRVINLGFGIEFMTEALEAEPCCRFANGTPDRVDFMENAMAFFGKIPTAPPTSVADAVLGSALSSAYPNPSNPITRLDYTARRGGRTTIAVYDVTGRRVRTLLDQDLEAGASGHVSWNGTNESGERCSSGVYFFRVAAPGWREERKVVVLR